MVIGVMENTTIFLSWLGTLTAGLLGVYALAFRTMKEVNRKVDTHVQDTKIHMDPEHPMVSEAVCQEVQKRIELHFDTLTSGHTEMKSDIKLILEKLSL